MALLAAGVRPGDRVIVPTLTFIATANAVRHAGAEPVFVDCDEFMNIDVDGVRSYLTEACERGAGGCVERASGAPVRAVLPVHVYGRPADLGALAPLAAEHGLAVIEDATEALGSRWTAGPWAGRAAGTVGHGGVLSFNGNKIATCGGGGAYLTSDAAAAARVRAPHDPGQGRHAPLRARRGRLELPAHQRGRGHRPRPARAARRLHRRQAPLPRALRRAAGRRARHRARRRRRTAPRRTTGSTRCWSTPSSTAATAKALMNALAGRGIESRPVWGLLHEQRPFRDCTAWRIERAPRFWARVLNLPCSSDLGEADVARVAARRSARSGGRPDGTSRARDRGATRRHRRRGPATHGRKRRPDRPRDRRRRHAARRGDRRRHAALDHRRPGPRRPRERRHEPRAARPRAGLPARSRRAPHERGSLRVPAGRRPRGAASSTRSGGTT